MKSVDFYNLGVLIVFTFLIFNFINKTDNYMFLWLYAACSLFVKSE